MNWLKQQGLIKTETPTSQFFCDAFPALLESEIGSPSQWIATHWQVYLTLGNQAAGEYLNKNQQHGAVFELLVITLFYKLGLRPLFIQAKITFVPNVHYDMASYCKEFGPIAFSLKTSLRERYKQADLEAIALKYVHRKAKCYLITLQATEALGVNKKIASGEVIGLDEVVVATNPRFDELCQQWQSMAWVKPDAVEILTGQWLVH
jgi:hypothetical protein